MFKTRPLDRWARALETGLTVLLLAAGLCGAVLWALNTEMATRRLPALLEQASGFRVQFGNVRFTLAPGLTMKARDVHIVNPTWPGEPEIMRADRMDVGLDLRALALGLPTVNTLLLDGVDFKLGTDERSRPNWSQPIDPNAGPPESYPAPAARAVAIKHAHIDYHDGAMRRDLRLDLDSATGSLPEQTPLSMILDGRLFDVPFSATIGGGLFRDFFYDHAHWPLQFSMQTSGIGLEARGVLDRPLSARRFDLNVAAAGAKLSAINELHGVPLPATGPFRFSARLSGVLDKIAVADSRLNFGRSDLGGDFVVRLIEGRRPLIKGRLAGGAVLLTDLLNNDAPPDPRDLDYANNGRTVSARPLPLDGLNAGDAELALSLQRLDIPLPPPPAAATPTAESPAAESPTAESPAKSLFPVLSLARIDAETKLVDRKLIVEPFSAALFGGWLSGRVQIDAAFAPPRVTLNGRIDHLDPTQALPTLAEGTPAPTGRLDVVVDVTGRGASPHALLANANGRMMLAMDGGALPIRHFDFIAADLITAVLPWIKRSESTPYNCIIARFGVSEGLAYTNDMLLDTEKITVLGSGSIDLATERIDFLFNPSPKDASLLSLATPVRLKGGFSGVSAVPDALGLARGAAVGAAGLAMGAMNPLGALLPFISIGTGENTPCLAALHRPFATPTLESNRPIDQIFNFIGSTAKPLLRVLPGVQ